MAHVAVPLQRQTCSTSVLAAAQLQQKFWWCLLRGVWTSLRQRLGQCSWGGVPGAVFLGRCSWGGVPGAVFLGRCFWGGYQVATTEAGSPGTPAGIFGTASAECSAATTATA
eukprot:255668-Chlamydomonas_euryale.AAC.1